MSLARAWYNTRKCVTQGYLSKFQHSNIQTFLRCFTFKSLINMHENTETSKSETDTNSVSTSPKTPEKKEKGLDVANKNEMKDNYDTSGKTELVIPENFSEMERNIFIAHKNAIEANYETYEDPLTGYDVLTREVLQSRGKCCGNACRHCPYGHVNVPEHLRTKKYNSQFYI